MLVENVVGILNSNCLIIVRMSIDKIISTLEMLVSCQCLETFLIIFFSVILLSSLYFQLLIYRGSKI